MKHTFLIAIPAMLMASCSGSGETPSPAPEPEEQLIFSATLAGTSPFKSTWDKNDALTVYASKGGKLSGELIKPESISEDGNSATFTSKGALPSDPEHFYAYLTNTGIASFKDGSGWVTADMNEISLSPEPVLAAVSNGKTFAFKQLYSAVKITVASDKVKAIVFEGREGEIINRENIISCTDLSVSPSTSSQFESTASIRGNVTGTGEYYVNLFNGLVLDSGYRISGYDAKGKLVARSESTEKLESVSGVLFTAPDFEYIDTRTKVFNPDDISYSFGVISDVHLNGQAGSEAGTKLKNALTLLQTQAGKNDANGVDAVLVVGDLMDTPYSSQSNYVQAEWFRTIYESVFNPINVPMIYTVGNHDVYGWWSANTYSEALNISQRLGENYFLTDVDKQMFQQYQCRHCVVGDCNILCVSPNSASPVQYPTAVISWLDSKLQDITSRDSGKYVLVLTHPMIYNTVYGSTLGQYWYTDALTGILKKYPQAIVFGGHLHFPINDPRSIWQGDFTTVGTGSVRYMAIEDGGYEDMKSATVMKDAYDITTGHLVQIDGSGNIRITRMYFTESVPFSGYWTISYPTSDKTHLAPYRFDTRKSANTAPQLSHLQVDCGGELPFRTVTATFSSGSDDEFVHHYVLTLTKDGTPVSTKKILADFYRHPSFSRMKNQWSVSMGDFGAGNYELNLVAYDSWDAVSPAKTVSFSIE